MWLMALGARHNCRSTMRREVCAPGGVMIHGIVIDGLHQGITLCRREPLQVWHPLADGPRVVPEVQRVRIQADHEELVPLRGSLQGSTCAVNLP